MHQNFQIFELKNHKKLLSELKNGKISDKETDEIKKVAEKIAKSF